MHIRAQFVSSGTCLELDNIALVLVLELLQLLVLLCGVQRMLLLPCLCVILKLNRPLSQELLCRMMDSLQPSQSRQPRTNKTSDNGGGKQGRPPVAPTESAFTRIIPPHLLNVNFLLEHFDL